MNRIYHVFHVCHFFEVRYLNGLELSYNVYLYFVHVPELRSTLLYAAHVITFSGCRS